MARFDIYADRFGEVDFLLDVQSDFHDYLPTRMAIPMVTPQRLGQQLQRLHLPLIINQQTYILVVPEMAALPRQQFGQRIASAAERSHDITAAIDFLLQGF